MKRSTLAVLLIVIVFCGVSSALAGEKRYRFTFHPVPAPNTFMLGKRVVISSKGLTISLKQLDKPSFANRFPAFQTDPDIHFFYFEFTLRNRTGGQVEINPIFFAAVTDTPEYRKPMNYDELYRLLKNFHEPEEFEHVLQKNLPDFFSPIMNGEEKTGILIFRNFREKAKECVIKLDAIAIAGEPLGFTFPYQLEWEVVRID